MSYTHYIFGHKIEEPSGFDGTLFKKELSSIYHGYMSNATGISLSDINLQITIDEKDIKELISQEIKEYGFNAKISYQIKWCEDIVFIGYIDVNSYSEDCCSCSFSVIETANDAFLSKRKVKYGLQADTSVLFTGKRISTSTTFLVNGDLNKYSYVGTLVKNIKHNIPLKIDKNTLSKVSVKDIDSFNTTQYFLTNTSGSIVNVTIDGVIEFTATSLPPITFQVKIGMFDANNVLINDEILGTYTATGAIVIHTSVNYSKNLYAGYKLQLYVDSATTSNNFDFFYSAASLTIKDTDESILKESTIKAIKLKDIFTKLSDKIGSAPIVSNWLNDCGVSYVITNGYNLRGIEKPVNADFESLFENISKIFCVGANYDTEQINIEPLESLNIYYDYYDLGDVEAQLKIDSEYNYSSINTGYDKWQSKLLYSTDEYNASQTYSNETNNTSNNELNLKSTLIASSYLIEELRLMKFEQNNANLSTDFDESLFIIAVVKSNGIFKAETDEFFEQISGIISPNDTYNLRLSPKRIALNWVNYLRLNSVFSLTAYEGNNQLSCKDNNTCGIYGIINEFSAIDTHNNKPRFSIFGAEIMLDKEPKVFKDFPAHVKYRVCGETYIGLVKSIEFKPDAKDGEITLQVINYN